MPTNVSAGAAGLALVLLLAPARAGAERARGGQISGRVADAAGSPLADVQVTVRGAGLRFARATRTSPAGTYRVEALPAGVYDLTCEREGFGARRWPGIRVSEGSRVTLDARLDLDRRDEGALAGAAPATISETRAGGRRFAGRAWSTLADGRLQSTNLSPRLALQGAGSGNPIHRVTDVGLEAGGPVWPGRAWLVASAERADSNVGVIGFYKPACTNADGTPMGAAVPPSCLEPDIRRVEDLSARVQWLWVPDQRSTITWGWSGTSRPARGASPYSRLEHTNRQSDLGWAQPFQVRHQAVLAGRVGLDASVSYSDASFLLDYHDPGLAGVQGAYDRYTLVHWRSGVRTEQRRPATQARAAVRLFGSSRRSTRLETTVGAETVNRTLRRTDRTGGGAVAVFDSRDGSARAYQARLVRDGETSHGERRFAAFVEQSVERGPLALEAGVRFSVQDDAARPASIPAHEIVPDLLPGVRFAGADSGVVFRDVEPSAGAAWSFGPGARTVVRAGFARSAAVGNTTSARLQPTGPTRLVYWWDDANGDGAVQRGEIDFGRGLAAPATPNYDPARPWDVRTPASVDRALRSVTTSELTLRVERQLTRRLSLRAGWVRRQVGRLQDAYRVNGDGSPVASDSFRPVRWTPAPCPPGARCPAVTYYERDDRLPSRTALRNDGRRGRLDGVDLALHKRQADGWMLDVAVGWSRARRDLGEPTRDFTDPTNVAMRDGTEYEMAAPRWDLAVRTSVALPWGLQAAAAFTARDGLPFARVVSSPNRGALGPTRVLTARYGSERYPVLANLECRLEGRLDVGRVSLRPALNVFNAGNAATVVGRNATQNSQSANAVTRVVAPRVIRLDLRASW